MHQIRNAIDWKSRRRERFAAETVHYKRGEAAIALPASRGALTIEDTGGDGIGVTTEAVVFVVRVDRLEIDGQFVTPEVGDRIIVGELDDGEVFEVRNIAGGRAWRYATSQRIEFRIFTNFVGEQPPDPE